MPTSESRPPVQAALRLRIRLSKGVIARHGGCLHAAVTATPPPAQPSERSPVALALVIDHSGSMNEPASRQVSHHPAPFERGYATKLDFVRSAAERLLDFVQDGDAIALVGFSTDVTVLKPLTVVDARSRPDLVAAVRRLHATDSTFLEGGLTAGIAQFSEEARRRYSCKVVLLSDGEANRGETDRRVLADRAASAESAGVTVSTLGVGIDYNSALMEALADSGNGEFHHVESPDGLDRILLEEFAAAAEVTARSAELELLVPDSLAVGTNLNGYPETDIPGGVSVRLGDLVRAKEVFFELSSPVPLRSDRLTIRVLARYRDAAGTEVVVAEHVGLPIVTADEAAAAGEDRELLARVVDLLRAQTLREAVTFYEGGQLGRAQSALETGSARLDQVSAVYGSAAFDLAGASAATAEFAGLEAEMRARRLSRQEAKQMTAAAYNVRRSRPPRPGT